VWKHIKKDDDRWLYLPALDLVKRIAATDKRTSFVGSHFYYEDVSGRSIHDDEHELIDTTEHYYVLKNTPKDKKLVEFAYYKMWIHRKSFIVVKTEYYDEQDRKYRVYEAKGVKTIQGYPTVTKARMTDLKANGHTDLEYEDVKYNIGVPESIFTERYLRRAPREYLR
jgi:outer membrane lipoprotein-sorting protein